jgi:hypothetical protein
MIRYLSIALLIILPTGIYAQKADSVKAPRVMKQWTLSPDYSEEVSVPLDTAFSLFNRYRASDRYSPFNAYLGNYGLPFYQINFFDRVTDPDKFLVSNYYPLMFLPDRSLFMNTQVPYTELDWSFAGPRETSEQTFRVRHSQSVNRYLNFGFIYDIVYSLGQYNYQRAEDKSFIFHSSYTGPKYKFYFSAGTNNLKAYENGGITTKGQLDQVSTRAVPTKLGGLSKANSLVKNKSLLIVQKYTIGGGSSKADSTAKVKTGFLGLSGTFSHIFIIEGTGRSYTDGYPTSGFYDNIYVTTQSTNDSVSERSIKNTLRFDFTTDESRKFRLGGGVGIRNENFKYYSITPVPFMFQSGNSNYKHNNNVVVGRLYNNIGDKFRWLATGELFLTGYRAGDFNLDGEISKSFDWKKGKASWLITGDVLNRQPSFWYEQWGGNNFRWKNNFKKEFRIDLGSTFSYPARKATLRFNYAIIDNYTDFDTLALPSQHSGGLSVISVMAGKEVRLWKFHLANDVLFQKSSNSEVLDLPLASIRSAFYFEHLFRFESTGGKLYFQLGADATYHTLYHPYSYMPSTGRFFRQEISTGKYPFVNAFINFKVKRTRVFIMFDHLNYKMMGPQISDNYDMIPNYPMNARMLRYGLSWTFYD